MPTIFTHAAFGFAVSKFAFDIADRDIRNPPSPESIEATISTNKRILIATTLLAALPDADALLMRWIAYADAFGHRGFTHSLFFAAIIGLASAFLFVKMKWNAGRSFWWLAALFAFATASHGFFDAMTTGGLGVAFFAPFDTTRHFFCFRPIPVAPFSAASLFTARGVNLLLWEFALIWTLAIGAFVWHRRNLDRKIAAIVCWAVSLLMWILKF